jgi:hypothetical protein
MQTYQNINKIFLATILASTITYASGPIDIGFNLGYADMPYEHEGNIADVKSDNRLINTEVYATFGNIFSNKNVRPTLSYIHNSNSDFKNNTLLAGVNLYIPFEQVTLYTGFLAGYGELAWDDKHISGTTKNDMKSGSAVAGLQLGMELPISDSLSFNVNAKYLMHTYDMEVFISSSSSARYSHTGTSSLSVGLKYSFLGAN